jgi:hypothetical protein
MANFNLFFLEKGEERWVFETKIRRRGWHGGSAEQLFPVAGLFGLGFIGLCFVGLVFGVPLAPLAKGPPSVPPPIFSGPAGAMSLAFAFYVWRRANWPLKAAFDFKQRRMSITIKRPWSEVTQTYSFAEIRSLYAARRTIWALFLRTRFWEGYLELANGKRIRLGWDKKYRDAPMSRYLGEIRAATGIAEGPAALSP